MTKYNSTINTLRWLHNLIRSKTNSSVRVEEIVKMRSLIIKTCYARYNVIYYPM